VKIFVQPKEGVAPLLKAIRGAKKSISILIFRFDRGDIEKALLNAVNRGVQVNALIAYTNRGGEKRLRDLEMRLLAAGVTVARTADDLIRYHGKMFIVDRNELFLLAFNFTVLDIDHSRSFGVSTRNPALVHEALKLFDADCHRKPYTAALPNFIVSPANARKELDAFIRGAKSELLIYDPHIGDPAILRLMEERAKAGVSVRILGRVSGNASHLEARKLGTMRLHTRAIVRDAQTVFLGSQSLRTAELDGRREIGLIFRSPQAVAAIMKTFEEDWIGSAEIQGEEKAWKESKEAKETKQPKQPVPAPPEKVAKKVAKAVAESLPPVGPALDVVVKQMVGRQLGGGLTTNEIEQTVKAAVMRAVKEVVHDVVDAAQEKEEEAEDAPTRA